MGASGARQPVNSYLIRDRVNEEMMHFYTERSSKMHFQNLCASQDASPYMENLLHLR